MLNEEFFSSNPYLQLDIYAQNDLDMVTVSSRDQKNEVDRIFRSVPLETHDLLESFSPAFRYPPYEEYDVFNHNSVNVTESDRQGKNLEIPNILSPTVLNVNNQISQPNTWVHKILEEPGTYPSVEEALKVHTVEQHKIGEDVEAFKTSLFASLNGFDLNEALMPFWGLNNYEVNLNETSIHKNCNKHPDVLSITAETGTSNNCQHTVKSPPIGQLGPAKIKFDVPTEKKEISKRGRKSLQQKPKTEAGKYQLLSHAVQLSVFESTIQCLSVIIDYHGYTGTIIGQPRISKNMINKAAMGTGSGQASLNLIRLYDLPPGEEFSPVSAIWQRVKYTRKIDKLHGSVSNIVYKHSSIFGDNNPYEPQYYRFELDDSGDIINESKSGLCPYCKVVKFLPFKNSSYLSHLTLEHGIFSNNFLTPEGLHYGKYLVTKSSSLSEDASNTPGSISSEDTMSDIYRRRNQHRPRETDGIVCPACHQIVEVGCWKVKPNPLLSYFRHFKKYHKSWTSQGTFLQTENSLSLCKRGRKLQVKES